MSTVFGIINIILLNFIQVLHEMAICKNLLMVQIYEFVRQLVFYQVTLIDFLIFLEKLKKMVIQNIPFIGGYEEQVEIFGLLSRSIIKNLPKWQIFNYTLGYFSKVSSRIAFKSGVVIIQRASYTRPTRPNIACE